MVKTELVSLESVEHLILFLRGHKVMLDEDLASLYRVEVRALNQAVGRNAERFPSDFMFRLTPEESQLLRSQSVILKEQGRGKHRKYQELAFTEQGVAMLSSVLRSPTAIQVNIEIMRAFVRIKKMQHVQTELGRYLVALEKKFDAQFRVVFDAIRALTTPPAVAKRPIGFGD